MRVISAYLLAVLGGNATPSEADVKKILSSVGIEAESERIQKLLSELEGKDLAEIMAAGKTKLAAMPAASSGGAAAPAAAGGAAAAAAPAPKKEEKKEESDEDMGFSLFD